MLRNLIELGLIAMTAMFVMISIALLVREWKFPGGASWLELWLEEEGHEFDPIVVPRGRSTGRNDVRGDSLGGTASAQVPLIRVSGWRRR